MQHALFSALLLCSWRSASASLHAIAPPPPPPLRPFVAPAEAPALVVPPTVATIPKMTFAEHVATSSDHCHLDHDGVWRSASASLHAIAPPPPPPLRPFVAPAEAPALVVPPTIATIRIPKKTFATSSDHCALDHDGVGFGCGGVGRLRYGAAPAQPMVVPAARCC